MHGKVRHILSLATGFFVDVSERQGTVIVRMFHQAVNRLFVPLERH